MALLYTCTGQRLKARAHIHSPADLPTGKLDLAAQCLTRASDFSGLLMLAAARGDREGMAGVGAAAAAGGKANVAFLAYFLLGRLNDCLDLLLDSNRWALGLQHTALMPYDAALSCLCGRGFICTVGTLAACRAG